MTKIWCFTTLMLMHGFCQADRLHDAIKYLDEIYSVYVPWAVEEAGLEIYTMPDIVHTFQNRTPDGASLNVKAHYHSGTLTGLDTLHRISCQNPEWTFSNLTFTCKNFLPMLQVQYEGELEPATGHTNSFREHRHPFSLKAVIKDVGFTLVVTCSPHRGTPAVKRLSLDNHGTPTVAFTGQDNISYERLSEQFFHHFNKVFAELFDGPYSTALNRAIGSIPYPFGEPQLHYLF